MLCYHNIDHIWHGKIYTNTITQKRIPCAGAQCCAVTTLTTSDTEKVQKCHPVQWLTDTQNIHFWVPVIVKFTHYRYKLPLYRAIPGTRAAWDARSRVPTYQCGEYGWVLWASWPRREPRYAGHRYRPVTVHRPPLKTSQRGKCSVEPSSVFQLLSPGKVPKNPLETRLEATPG